VAITDTVKQKIDETRARVPAFDHLIRMNQHYGAVKGNALAGAVTYFGFLSFFPILALAFAVVGVVSAVYDVEEQLVEGIQSVLPMIVSGKAGAGELSISVFQQAAGAAAGVGAVGVLYSGLGWVSGLRQALLLVFEKPAGEQPNFFVGKLKDVLSLALIGLTMIVSVGVAGLIGSLSKVILEFLQLGAELGWLMQLISVGIGLAANMVLFYAVFRLLADPVTPKRSLWSGALLGAVGFEVLKKLALLLLGLTKEQPAFAVFGIALILVVWINYFSRVVMYAASWAHTSPEARAQREAQELAARAVEGPQLDLAAAARTSPVAPSRGRLGKPKAFAAGAASALGVLAWLRRNR
jgi:membrane protein